MTASDAGGRDVSAGVSLPVMLQAVTRDRLLRRIGLRSIPSTDAAGLRTVHRAFLTHVPYEDLAVLTHVPYEELAVPLDEAKPLDPRSLAERFLHGGRGGYCFEANTVLHALLETLGFSVQRREGIVGARTAYADGESTDHMALVVDTPDAGAFIADAGLEENSLGPLPLADATVTSGAFEFTVERDARSAPHERISRFQAYALAVFRMTVQDVFAIRHRGTVTTGKVELGTLRVGDTVRIDDGETVRVDGIEAFRKVLDEAQAGDNVGLLFKDLDRGRVQRGAVLSGE